MTLAETTGICGNEIAVTEKKHLKTAALRAYTGNAKQSVADDRINECLSMVPKIVQRVVSYLRPPLSFDDLVSAGTIGLVKAARDYDPSHKAEFKTYAFIRIRGAVIDELRNWSFVPAKPNRQIHEVMAASRKISEETGLAPDDAELAEILDISLEKLYEIFSNARAQQFLSIDGMDGDKPTLGSLLAAYNADTPDIQIEKAELVELLAKTIEQLPKKQRQVILLYYQQHLTMKETAEVLDLTESRVSQLHASAIFSLSLKMRLGENGRE
ncbi:MAG: FliA/WhiG family RNA polymerase sigma factor [Candidatus Brocadiia bacterium]|nr:MAG: FliA/WhiG family RNA polymerase sigma factor [Candidatus Brocadiia bacterium]